MLKKFFIKIFAKFLLLRKLIEFYHDKKRKNKQFFSQNKYEKKLLNFFNYKNGFYIELGANDGINQSNTYYFEKNLGWSGILIEPTRKYEKLIKNRSSKNFFFNCACDDFKCNKKLKMVYSDLMSTVIKKNDINAFQHAKKGRKYLYEWDNENYIFECENRTLDSILRECQSPALIDFLSLDVEGYEFNVLNGLNFNKNNFKYILIETFNLKKIKEFLFLRNYKLIEKFGERDYLFKYNI